MSSTSSTIAFRPDPDPGTPYRRARQEWDDRIGSAIAQARNWRLAAFVSFATVVFAVAGLVYLGRQPKAVPHVIEVDHLGGAVYRGPVGQDQYPPSDAVIRYHLQRFVQDTRAISSDQAVLRQAWLDAYTAVTPKAANMLSAYVQAPDHDPFKRALEARVTIESVSTVRVSQDTWQLDWRETTWDTHGQQVGIPTLWRGMFRVTIQPPTTPKSMEANPIGLYVDEFHWDTVAR